MKIGKCYLKLGKPFKALKAFHQSIHEDPQLDQAWVETSDLYEDIGNYEEALYYLDLIPMHDSDNKALLRSCRYHHINRRFPPKLDQIADLHVWIDGKPSKL